MWVNLFSIHNDLYFRLKYLTVWEINGRNLLRKSVVHVMSKENNQQPCIMTAMAYMSYSVREFRYLILFSLGISYNLN